MRHFTPNTKKLKKLIFKNLDAYNQVLGKSRPGRRWRPKFLRRTPARPRWRNLNGRHWVGGRPPAYF